MKRFHLFTKIFILLVLAGAVASCNKDDKDMVARPTITITELGSGNSKKAFAGSDLHIEAEILAPGTIDRIVLEIQSAESGGWNFSETFTDDYSNTKNATFHEHVDIPATVTPGTYRVHMEVYDKNGQVSSAESDLGIEKQNPSSALVFTRISGAGVEAHGDHFHGLAGGTEGASDTVTFDGEGAVIAHGHLHLAATGVYKVSLKTYNASGTETQARYIADATTAENFKAFLVGGNYVLNPATTSETGAIFQTRETSYANGATVSGATATTGVTSYFTAGNDNKGNKDVTFIMRKLNAGVKPTITRTDWNRSDYATEFAGSNELQLKFEIHAE
ncbi:MAG: DUF4625 domain-containing protein [Chitinophagaceae bacterium]|nr:MAG: DUF4625 domain-containing protein [Chitinophagaceae bacterium]